MRPVLLNASRAPKTAALTSRMSCAVSMISRSAPPSIRPAACSEKTSTSSPKRICPSEGSSEAGRIAGRADRARHEAVLARRLASDFRGLGVDLDRVVGQAPLVELDPGGLEGVGLEHFGAGLEHRAVHSLDHVGPVEHQRLVALAVQAAVVLAGELELLERGAHAAVVDDDVALDRLQVVAHAMSLTTDERPRPSVRRGATPSGRSSARLGRHVVWTLVPACQTNVQRSFGLPGQGAHCCATVIWGLGWPSRRDPFHWSLCGGSGRSASGASTCRTSNQPGSIDQGGSNDAGAGT